MMVLASVVLGTVAAAAAAPPTNNMNGFDYVIANANGDKFTGDFEQMNTANYGSNQYFDVYSPLISTVYGQVYWTMMDSVPLPDDIIEKFKGKTMAITGYESDQVQRTPTGDIPLPITAAYNHHYTGYINSNSAQLERVKPEHPERIGHMESDGLVSQFVDVTGSGKIVSAALHEGNGGEFRQSFHGFPKGWAQLIDSPTEFRMSPMQIDTWNRENKNFDGFWPGPEPLNSEAPANAPYSGLLECPCTTRMSKQVDSTVVAQATGECATPVTDASSCAAAVKQLNPPASQIISQSGTNESMPLGCSLILTSSSTPTSRGKPQPQAVAYFNELKSSSARCGARDDSEVKMFGWANPQQTGVANLGLYVEVEGSTFRLVITGPANVWFGIGVNTTTMAGNPYAVIVDGNGNVTERQLGNEAAGVLLPATMTVESSSVSGDRRTVVVSRPIAATDTFRLNVGELQVNPRLPIIAAVGSGKTFAYHQAKGSSLVQMFAVDAPTCVCEDNSSMPFGKGKGYFLYTPPPGEPGTPESHVPGANFTRLAFAKNCLPYPSGTMLLGKNPSCDLRSYTGGQSCCHHLVTLLDADQVTPWQEQPLEYVFKWRIYYRDAAEGIENVIQHNWGGMATPTEYDVPKCSAGIEGCSFEDGHWVHRMNGTWTVAEMVPNGNNFEPVTIHGHCHAPTCVDFTLYNADTNEIICQQRPNFGQSNRTFDESGYISVPPCVFGDASQGLQPLISLPPSTRLFSTKTCKADAGHHGEMSLWQTYCRV